MIVCPVCEHPQPQGAECEVCGKKLLEGRAGRPQVAPVEGLEPTLHEEVDAAAEPLPELEPTLHAAVEGSYEPVPEVDPGRAAPVDVAEDRVPDLEPSGEEQREVTAVPLLVTCRYCRTPALGDERVCGRCGMRLPTFERRAEEAQAPPRTCSCGAVVSGPRCPTCGARLA